ncbi:MAG: GFA family protein [Planctomycetota bacterium]
MAGALAPANACHCSRCRKAFSGAGSAMTFVAPGTFRWVAGEAGVRDYVSEAGWGLGFCQRCGSTLVATHGGAVVGITLGTLDGDPEVEIGQHLFVGSKAGWDQIGGSAPQFEERPPA